jgi:hypothetical protein
MTQRMGEETSCFALCVVENSRNTFSLFLPSTCRLRKSQRRAIPHRYAIFTRQNHDTYFFALIRRPRSKVLRIQAVTAYKAYNLKVSVSPLITIGQGAVA